MPNSARRRFFSETDIRLLILTGAGTFGCILGFVVGLLTGHA